MAWLLLLVGGCLIVDPVGISIPEPDGTPNPPTADLKTDTFGVQVRHRPVDLVVIAQDSCCADVELMEASVGLSGLLTDLDLRGADVHVGVFTTTADQDDGGRLLALPDGRRWITEAEAGDAGALLDVGRNGSVDERGLRSAWRGLHEPLADTVNAGFRRAGAELHMLAVGDQDDQSGSDPTVGAFAAFVAREQPDPAARSFSAIVCADPTRDTCPTSEPATRYLDLVARLGGDTIAFDGLDITPRVRALGSLILRDPEFILTDVPDPATIRLVAEAGPWSWFGVVDPAACATAACGVVVFDPVRNSVTPRWDAPDGAVGEVSVSYALAR
jgi:hypothetical protein